MMLKNFVDSMLPQTSSPTTRARARIIVTTSLFISAAMLALILYWIATRSFEDIETIVAAVILGFILAGVIDLVRRGHINAGAWILTSLMILLNLANMASYGIATTSSAAYIIAILLAVFGIGLGAGWSVTFLGCVSVFIIAWLSSIGQLQTTIPFQESNLTFDAPVLSLIFLLTAALASGWVRSTSETIAKS